jgi:hypothetical protein
MMKGCILLIFKVIGQSQLIKQQFRLFLKKIGGRCLCRHYNPLVYCLAFCVFFGRTAWMFEKTLSIFYETDSMAVVSRSE